MNAPTECQCGQTYDGFRAQRVRSYVEAYHEIAWTRTHTSRSAVLRHWAKSKAQDWAAHLDACAWEAEAAAEAGPAPEEGDASFDPSAWTLDPTVDEWGGELLTPVEPPPAEGPAPAAHDAPRPRRIRRTPVARPRSPKPPQGPPRAPRTGLLWLPSSPPSSARGPPVRFSCP